MEFFEGVYHSTLHFWTVLSVQIVNSLFGLVFSVNTLRALTICTQNKCLVLWYVIWSTPIVNKHITITLSAFAIN